MEDNKSNKNQKKPLIPGLQEPIIQEPLIPGLQEDQLTGYREFVPGLQKPLIMEPLTPTKPYDELDAPIPNNLQKPLTLTKANNETVKKPISNPALDEMTNRQMPEFDASYKQENSTQKIKQNALDDKNSKVKISQTPNRLQITKVPREAPFQSSDNHKTKLTDAARGLADAMKGMNEQILQKKEQKEVYKVPIIRHKISATQSSAGENKPSTETNKVNLKSSNSIKNLLGIESNYKKDLIQTLEDIKKVAPESKVIDKELKALKESKGEHKIDFKEIKSELEKSGVKNNDLVNKINKIEEKSEKHGRHVEQSSGTGFGKFVNKLLESRGQTKDTDRGRG